jgi:hypothetical protein
VISSGGDYLSAANGSLSSTIGEPITETFNSSVGILTQGFQQSKYQFINISEPTTSNLKVIVFPNPTSNLVKIIVKKADHEKLSYRLYEPEGKIMAMKDFVPPETNIDFTSFATSTYILKVYAGDEEISSFKIIKQ